MNQSQWNDFETALLRLKKDEPLEHILGEVKFFGRTFQVNSSVHVPRPETQTMVKWVLQDFKVSSKSKTLSLLDIGTGAGVLPITLANEMPKISVTAIDISEEALEIARKNAYALKASVEFIKKDLFKLQKLPNKFNIIVSHPPYILKHSQKDVQRNYLSHEPPLALYVEDDDPMIFNRKIAELAQKSLKENGAVYVEINQYLKNETEKVFQSFGFKTEFKKDIYGNPRTLKAFKKWKIPFLILG